jgi:hypothetical protein
VYLLVQGVSKSFVQLSLCLTWLLFHVLPSKLHVQS